MYGKRPRSRKWTLQSLSKSHETGKREKRELKRHNPLVTSQITMHEINILQINTNNSKKSHDLTSLVAYREKIDFIVISEPNNQICNQNTGHMYSNEQKNTAVINSSRKYNVYKYFSSHCYVCVVTKCFILYSVYITPNCNMDNYVEYLEELKDNINWIKQTYNNKDIVISGDFSAKHSWWGGQEEIVEVNFC